MRIRVGPTNEESSEFWRAAAKTHAVIDIVPPDHEAWLAFCRTRAQHVPAEPAYTRWHCGHVLAIASAAPLRVDAIVVLDAGETYPVACLRWLELRDIGLPTDWGICYLGGEVLVEGDATAPGLRRADHVVNDRRYIVRKAAAPVLLDALLSRQTDVSGALLGCNGLVRAFVRD